MCIVCRIESLSRGIYDLFDPSDVGASISLGYIPGADTVAGTAATTETISPGGSESGVVNFAGEQDWFRTTLITGQTYTFRLDGFVDGALRDADLRLFSSSGALIIEDDDRATNPNGFLASDIIFTPTRAPEPIAPN